MAVRSSRRTSALGRSATDGVRLTAVDHRIEKRPFNVCVLMFNYVTAYAELGMHEKPPLIHEPTSRLTQPWERSKHGSEPSVLNHFVASDA
jgi:hypothetical protein